MKTTRFDIIVAVLLLSLLLIGAVTRSIAKEKNKGGKPGETVLVYERKPCYGYCPAYKAKFFASGLVLVTEMQHVKLAGKPEYQFKLTPKEINQLYASAQENGFFTFPDRFKTQATDIPARELTLYKKGKTKKVVFEEMPPEGIKDVTDQLESIIESKINPKE